MSDFVKEIHNMFDHIWDCEIDHPVYQDTVGELMEAVIQTYEKHKPTLSTNLASLGTDAISRQQAIETVGWYSCHSGDKLLFADNVLRQLPPIQPKRGRWVLVCDNNGMHFICNKCGAWRYHQEQKFCGECGADMRGEQNG